MGAVPCVTRGGGLNVHQRARWAQHSKSIDRGVHTIGRKVGERHESKGGALCSCWDAWAAEATKKKTAEQRINGTAWA